jgi:hypothetical protein
MQVCTLALFMRLKFLILITLLIIFSDCSFAQQKSDLTQSRILILLDGSSSMVEPWAGGKQKFKVASELIDRLMDSVYAVNSDVEFSLRVFGHQHTVEENYCYDTKNEVPFARSNRIRMALRLDAIHPLGVTPIAYALKEAAEQDITDIANNAYSIILITDGGESCGGDICEVMRKLIKNKIIFRPYIVSLENDFKLKTTYSCMGDYLQVISDADVPVAVSTIVKAFRPVLRITATDYKELQTTAAKADLVKSIPAPKKDTVVKVVVPEVKKDTIARVVIPPAPKRDTVVKKPDTIVFTRPEPGSIVVRPPAEKLVALAPAGLKPFNIYSEYNTPTLNFHPVDPGISLPPVLMDTPEVVRTKEKMVTATVLYPRSLAVSIAPPAAAKIIEPSLALPPLVFEPPAPPREVAKISKLKPALQHPFNVFFVIEDHSFSPREVPALPPVKYDPAVVVKKPAPPENTAEYTATAEEAKETSLEILFTNGKGKYYASTPQVFLIEPGSKKVVKKFYRTVDANGNPDPQTDIPAGNYDLAFTPRKGLIIHSVHVEGGKKNRITVTVKNTTLSFAYADDPERPVKEFAAVVIERNKAQGRVQNQKGTEHIEYEPGNYHIDINTFPIDRRNVDLDFDAETVITIPQPGFAKFTAQGDTKSVSLYQRLGDKFLNFFSFNLSDPRSQHLQIQPGEYQVHYQKAGSPGEQVVQFLIKSTKETEVILK